MGDQVMSKTHQASTALNAAAEVTAAPVSGLETGVAEGATVTRSGSGCVRYPGVTQEVYGNGPAQERPSRLFGASPKLKIA